MITLAKRGDLAARRAVIAEFPNEPLVVRKLFDEIAPKYADRTSGLHPDRPPRPARRRRRRDRPDRARLTSDRRASHGGQSATAEGAERAPPGGIAPGSNTTARTSPGSRSSLGPGRSRGSSRPRWLASRGVDAGAVDGAGRTDAGVHATGPGDRLHLRGPPLGGGAGTGARRAPAGGRRDPRPATGAGGVPPPLCGAVPGVPLHRLERAAQPAPRASRARGAGPARHRRDGASRVGPHRPARLPGLRGGGPDHRSGPSTRSGSRRQGRS